ncbi:hypothetical protein HDU82_008380 [Entophlyctis luteolus]|nr:hypothetical protein HDU82_008380 [Entophlyctis luteolus]
MPASAPSGVHAVVRPAAPNLSNPKTTTSHPTAARTDSEETLACEITIPIASTISRPTIFSSKAGPATGAIGFVSRIQKSVTKKSDVTLDDNSNFKSTLNAKCKPTQNGDTFNRGLGISVDSTQPEQTAQAQPIPPPIKPVSWVRKSLQSFPVLSQFSRNSSSAGVQQNPKKTSPKRSNTASFAQLRASAADFFNGIMKSRANSHFRDEVEEDTGGEALEEDLTAQPSGSVSQFSLHPLGEYVRDTAMAVADGAQKVGERIMSAGRNQFHRASNALKPSTQHFAVGPSQPKEPKNHPLNNSSKKNEIGKKYLSQAQKEEDERNSRLADIAAFMNGSKCLPDTFAKNYNLGGLLGDGAFGFVMTATRLSDGKEVAVKFISREKIPYDLWVADPSAAHGEKVPIEVATLQKINHPNIIRYIDHMAEKFKYVLLITELHGSEWCAAKPHDMNPVQDSAQPKKRAASVNDIPNVVNQLGCRVECSPLFMLSPDQEQKINRKISCDLFECIDSHKRIPEKLAKKIFAQIVLAVEYLQQNNLVHRDLKDENIVIDRNYNIKLIDFGSVAAIPKTEREYFTKFSGTIHFASPEISNSLPYRGPESEIWSLGVLLYTIVFGENPFHSREEIIRGEYRVPYGILESDSNPKVLVRQEPAMDPNNLALGISECFTVSNTSMLMSDFAGFSVMVDPRAGLLNTASLDAFLDEKLRITSYQHQFRTFYGCPGYDGSQRFRLSMLETELILKSQNLGKAQTAARQQRLAGRAVADVRTSTIQNNIASVSVSSESGVAGSSTGLLADSGLSTASVIALSLGLTIFVSLSFTIAYCLMTRKRMLRQFVTAASGEGQIAAVFLNNGSGYLINFNHKIAKEDILSPFSWENAFVDETAKFGTFMTFPSSPQTSVNRLPETSPDPAKTKRVSMESLEAKPEFLASNNHSSVFTVDDLESTIAQVSHSFDPRRIRTAPAEMVRPRSIAVGLRKHRAMDRSTEIRTQRALSDERVPPTPPSISPKTKSSVMRPFSQQSAISISIPSTDAEESTIQSQKEIFKVQALVAYKPEMRDELSLKVGDVISVTKMYDDG